VRYSVHFQRTTEEWVLFDNVFFCMLPERFESKKDAQLEVSFLTSAERRKALRKSKSTVLNAS